MLSRTIHPGALSGAMLRRVRKGRRDAMVLGIGLKYNGAVSAVATNGGKTWKI